MMDDHDHDEIRSSRWNPTTENDLNVACVAEGVDVGCGVDDMGRTCASLRTKAPWMEISARLAEFV